jgi:hypothetical protein
METLKLYTYYELNYSAANKAIVALSKLFSRNIPSDDFARETVKRILDARFTHDCTSIELPKGVLASNSVEKIKDISEHYDH